MLGRVIQWMDTMYKAHRDYRFEYAHDVIHFIEEEQCYDCAFRNEGGDMMCDSIAIGLLLEKTLEDLDDRGEDGVVCTAYLPAQDEPVDPDHPKLF